MGISFVAVRCNWRPRRGGAQSLHIGANETKEVVIGARVEGAPNFS